MNRRPGFIRVWTVLSILLLGMGFAVEASAAPGDPLAFFTVVPPCRVFDSRETPPQFIGDGPALSGGVSRFIPIIGSNGNCNIPAEAEVVTFNVTVTQPTTGGKLFIGPGGSDLPSDAMEKINFTPGSTRANNAMVTLAAGGIEAEAATGGTVHVILDITGYYAPAGPVNDATTVDEDAAATAINVLANDSNPSATITSVTQPANGTVVLTGGSPGAHTGLTYQPDANYCNTPPGTTLDTFTYTINPGNATATVSVTVTCVDDDPVAVDDSATVAEDAAATAIDVLANDTDVDGGPISVTAVTQPANGTVVITGGGTGLTYQPKADYCNNPPGTTLDTFTYTLTPGGDTATVSVTVNCNDGSPTANNDSATVNEDAAATAINVLANDTDEEGDAFTIASVTQPANGTVVITGGGTGLTYQPNPNYCNTPPGTTLDTFTYTLTPGGSTATVTVTVTCVNDDPVAVDDSATMAEDAAATAIDVLANDTDVENDAFTITSVTQPANGTVVITGGGTGLTYQPNADYCTSSTPDTFTYTLTPGGDTATVSVTVTCLEGNPVAVDDSATVAEDAPATAINVLANDTDEEGDTFTITSVTQPANGAVVITGGGTGLTYQPNANYCNTPPGTTLDTFTYTLTPGGDSATVTVTVTCVDDNPTAVNDAATVLEDAAATPIDVLANDTDPENNAFTITSVTQPANGTVAITGGGTGLTYQPNANYCNSVSGTPDTFTYTLTPGGSTATVSMTVTCVEDNPTAVDDAATVAEDSGATAINVLANDTDPDGGTNTISAVTQPANGTVVITGGGTGLTYQPNANFCTTGTPDTFTYTLAPGGSTATVSVTVTCVDDNPTAVNDSATVLEDAAATPIDVLANDTDADGGARSITSVTQPANGTVVITGGGTGLTYQPSANYCNSVSGTPDTFTYTLTPGGSTATVSMTVTCVEDNPTAVNDAATVLEDATATAIAVLANDTDPDGGTNTISAVTQPASGAVVITGGGTGLTYQPNANFCTTGTPDTFTYTLTPGGSVATVSVTVTCVDDNPVAVADATTVLEDAAATAIDVLANDTDPDGGPKSVSSVTQPANGAVVITGGGTGLTYQPNPNFCGSDSFGYTLSPGGSSTTVSVTVTCVNDAPVLADSALEYTILGNTQLRVGETTPGASVLHMRDNQDVDEKAAPSDVDGPGPLQVVPFSGNTGKGDLVLNADGTFTYEPNAGFEGTDTFNFQVTDNGTPAATATGTITITVSQMVWYVHDVTGADNPSTGDTGRSTNAFEVLADAATAATDNDYIFVFEGNTGTTPHNGGFKLDNTGVKLHGHGIGLTVPGFGTLIPAGNRPRIAVTTNATPQEDNGVSVDGTVASLSGVEVRGFQITGFDNAIDVTATGGNNVGLTISDNTLAGSNAEGIDVNANGTGTVTVDVQNNGLTGATNGFDARTGAAGQLRINFSNHADITAGANAVHIDGSFAGSLATITGFSNNSVHQNTGGTGVVINAAIFDSNAAAGIQAVDADNLRVGISGNGAGGAGVLLTNVQGALSFDDLDIFADNGAGLRVSGTGSGMTFTVPAGVGIIEATNGPAVDVTSTALGLPLQTLKSTNTGSTGVSLVNVSDGTLPAVFSAGSGSSITTTAGATGPAFNISGGNASITYGGTITNNGVGRAVSISTWTGDDPGDDILFSGAIAETGAGILVNGNGGTGRSITFSGGLDIDTTTGEGFAATSNTNSGGLHITGTNTIDSVSATGLRVTDTTIGNSDLTFQRISSGNNTAAADPANGIVLTNTGTLGGLTVTGTGGAALGGNSTGGLIQNTTGHAIALTNTMDPSFTNMSLQSASGSGVNGTQVTNFTFKNSTSNVAGTGGAADEANVAFNDSTSNPNVSGTVTITDNVINNSRYHGVDIQNSTGTVSHANISNNTFTSSTSVASSLGSAVRLVALGSASAVAHVNRATIANNTITNFPSGAGFVIQGGNAADVVGAPSGTLGIPGSGTDVIAITGNQMDGGTGGVGNQPDRFVTALVNGRGQGNFNISNNGTAGTPIRRIDGVVIELSAFGAATVTSNITNNFISANNAVGSSGIGVGCDADSLGTTTDNASLTSTISGNVISQTDGPGIYALARNSNCSHTVKITNNTVAAPATTGAARAGIRVDSGSSSGDTTVCLEISGNTTSGSTNTGSGSTSPGINLRKQGTVATTNDFGIEGLSPSPTGTPTVENHVNGLNTSSSGTFGVGGTALLSGTSGFISCNVP